MNDSDQDFSARRQAARERLERLKSKTELQLSQQGLFFEHVYETAGDDEAAIPWADLKPKDEILQWLGENPGIKREPSMSPVGWEIMRRLLPRLTTRQLPLILQNRRLSGPKNGFQAALLITRLPISLTCQGLGTKRSIW